MVKAGFPYLVDIAITKRCMKNCPFCYASATMGGQHANEGWLWELARVLKAANVMEVVLGGGEPTLFESTDECSGLLCFLRQLSKGGFVVSLTTANYEWYKSEWFSDQLRYLDSIAVSINSKEDLRHALPLFEALRRHMLVSGGWYRRPSASLSVQTIVGYTPWEEVVNLLRDVKTSLRTENITLLGYRVQGRASKSAPLPVPPTFVDDIKAIGLNRLGIDAQLAREWGPILEKNGVESYRLGGEEGKQTCFVDAVDQTMSPSSFSDVKIPILKPMYASANTKNFLDAFASF